ncbi:MAG TPA: methionyl-tRNA formyltransferase [Gammaproteobacteria bacterium]|nr:methionyl-tRNA formyltransferase [Gammaproteobacteria bacterium]
MDCQHLRVIFAGTPDFAVPALSALIASTHEVVAVYTQPDRPAGRGRKLSASAVKQCAEAHRVPVYQPESLRNAEAQAALRALDADVMVVAAYGLILPVAVLQTPRLGCINIHASLLPRWRGAAPIQRAIEAGDSHSGVTIMQMAKGLDTGDMLLKASVELGASMTAAQLHDQLAEIGSTALLRVLPALCAGTLEPEVQDDALANYAPKITKAEAEIDWSLPAVEIHRKVRAFNPFPIAFTRLDDKVMRVWDAELSSATWEPAVPGDIKVEDNARIIVATSEGALVITRLQMPGKKPLSAAEFLNSRQLAGARLG